MFTRRRSAPSRLSAVATCLVPAALEQVWSIIVRPDFNVDPAMTILEGDWLPGHRQGIGAMQYATWQNPEGLVHGGLTQVVDYQPPRALTLRSLQPQTDQISRMTLTLASDGEILVTYQVWTDPPAGTPKGLLFAAQSSLNESLARCGAYMPTAFQQALQA